MDNHFPDDMTYWSERPSLPKNFKSKKYKRKGKSLFYRDVVYIFTDGNKIKKLVIIYLFKIKLFSYKTKI